MDLYITFKDINSTPEKYLPYPTDEVEWDEVDPGRPFYVIGAESIILRILANAEAAMDVHYHHLF